MRARLPLMMLLSAGCAGQVDPSPGAGASAATAAPVSALSARLDESIGSLIDVRWTQDEAVDQAWVEYSVDAGQWRQSPATDGAAGEHEQLLLGIPYDHAISWRVVNQDGDLQPVSAEQHASTGPLPASVPTLSLEIADEGGWDPAGSYLFTSVTERDTLRSDDPGFWLAVIDRQGRYVWLLPAAPQAWAFHPEPSRDQTALLWEESYSWSGVTGTDTVRRVRLDGSVVRTWETPGLHHAFDEIDDETIVYNAPDEGRDDVVWIQGAEGERRAVWDCGDWYASEGLSFGGGSSSCGANAIARFEPHDSVLLSLFNDGSLLELALDSGEVLWHSAPQQDHGLASDTTWYWQHDPSLIAEDRVLMSAGGYDPGNEGAARFDFTAVYELAVDREAAQITLDWSYVSRDWVSSYKSSAARTAGGDTLHSYGDVPGVREITPGGEVVWQLRVIGEDDSAWIGRCRLLDDLYTYAP